MTSADIPDRAEPPAGSALPGPRAQAPKRRTFSTAYKQRIVRQYDSLTDPVERGALLRREGLYHSHLEYWRATMPTDKGGDAPPAPAKSPGGRPARSDAEVEIQRLRAENERLTAELGRTKAALDVTGKLCALLETLSESADSDMKPNR